ncbi:MAG: hypothetical protein KAS62_05875 [Candidatus Delongbacteria bacterium]|nr:hypothetical protein [Candidatus Delongbacteria bacterium]
MEEQIKKKYEVDLIEIIAIIWQARRLITIITGLSFLISILYIIFVTPIYRSSITLYPATDKGSNSPMLAMVRQLGVGGYTGESNYNIPDVVKSRTLSEQIILHEWTINGYDKKITLVEYFNKLRKVEKPNNIINKADDDKWNEDILHSYSIMMASSRINVNTNIETGLITVSVDMEDPNIAKDIANFISLFVTNWVNDTQKESVRDNLLFINERATVLDIELQEAEIELKKFRETNRNILNSPDLQLELQRLKRQVTIKQEVYLTMVKQREINQIEENKTSNVVKILDKAIIGKNVYRSKRKLIVFVSTVFSFFFGIALVIAIEIYKGIFGALRNRRNTY